VCSRRRWLEQQKQRPVCLQRHQQHLHTGGVRCVLTGVRRAAGAAAVVVTAGTMQSWLYGPQQTHLLSLAAVGKTA
jgi:hypothetical protein